MEQGYGPFLLYLRSEIIPVFSLTIIDLYWIVGVLHLVKNSARLFEQCYGMAFHCMTLAFKFLRAVEILEYIVFFVFETRSIIRSNIVAVFSYS